MPNYRYIKKICRGEARPYWGLLHEPGEFAWTLNLEDCIYNVVYMPKSVPFRRGYYIVNTRTDLPIFWFVRSDEYMCIQYLIGIRFDDLIGKILNKRKKIVSYVMKVPVIAIFREYIYHLKWKLEKEGIKNVDKYLTGTNKLFWATMERDPDFVYGTMAKIFTNYIKLKTKWETKL